MTCSRCGHMPKGYHHHEADRTGRGCGLVNSIQCDAEHTHYYCRCGHEWVDLKERP